MILYMVGKLALNSTQFTKGLVKYVHGRGCFRAIPSENGDKFATSPTPPIVEQHACRVGNLTRLIHTLAICVTIHYINIYTSIAQIKTCFLRRYKQLKRRITMYYLIFLMIPIPRNEVFLSVLRYAKCPKSG